MNVGPDESAIAAAGSSQAGNAFNAIGVHNGGSLVYDTAHARGSFAARHSLPSRGDSYYEWDGNLTRWYGRVYLWLDANPTSALRVIRAASNNTLRFAIDILASGQVRIVDSANRTIATIANTIATGRWVRVEWSADQSQGRVELRLFNTADSTTPTAVATSASGAALGTSTGQVQIGRSGSQAFAITFWTDDPAVSTTGYPGPSG